MFMSKYANSIGVREFTERMVSILEKIEQSLAHLFRRPLFLPSCKCCDMSACDVGARQRDVSDENVDVEGFHSCLWVSGPGVRMLGDVPRRSRLLAPWNLARSLRWS